MSGYVSDRCEVCTRTLAERPDPRRRRCVEHLGQRDLFPRAAVRTPRRRADEGPSAPVRVVETVPCPACVGAHPVADWSLLDPCCELCVGCGRITLDSPVAGATAGGGGR